MSVFRGPVVNLDTETRSDVNLKKSNVYRYVQSDTFSVLMMAYGINNGPVKLTTDPAEIRDLFLTWHRGNYTLCAHNAAFDRIALSVFSGLPEYHDPARWEDPAVWAAEAGYPRALKLLAKALGTEEKDEAGTALINWFCKPQKDGTYRRPEDHPEKWAQFCAYCVTDVEVLQAVRMLLPRPTRDEHELWVTCERINDRGMPIDVELARMADQALTHNEATAKARVSELLGIDNAGSVMQLRDGLAKTGLVLPNLKAPTVEAVLENPNLTDVQRESLQLRQDLALSAAKKFPAALTGVCVDGRIRGAFKFFGASTGRFSGSGAQPQNLPRAAFKATKLQIVDRALADDVDTDTAEELENERLVDEAISFLMASGGTDPLTLKMLVRPMFVGPMTVFDFSSIEARVLAWLARELWALQAFSEGRDIYVETARRMGPEYDRQQGKAATLGLGYMGGPNALRKVGMDGTDEELNPIVVNWRATNQRIVQYWQDLYQAWIHGGLAGRIKIKKSLGAREMVLPSGRSVWYRGVRWEKYTVEYVDEEGLTHRESKEGWRYTRASRGRVRIWPGILAENVTQAVARDLLANSLMELEREGLPVTAHVHDEVWIEGFHDLSRITEIMCRTPKWAAGLPMAANGFTAMRYHK